MLDEINSHEAPVTCLSYSPQAQLLASGSWDRSVRIYNIYAKQAKDEIYQHNDRINAISWRGDGKQLASSTFRGEVYLWDTENE